VNSEIYNSQNEELRLIPVIDFLNFSQEIKINLFYQVSKILIQAITQSHNHIFFLVKNCLCRILTQIIVKIVGI